MLGNFPQFSGQLYFFEHPTNTPRVFHVDTMFEREINVHVCWSWAGSLFDYSVKIQRIVSAEVLTVTKLKTFTVNSNLDSWKLNISVYHGGLYFLAEILINQGFLRFSNNSLQVQIYNFW